MNNSEKSPRVYYARPKLPTYTYVSGYILCLALTVSAYLLVTRHVAHGTAIIAAVIALALLQFMVQLLFFLHLGRETRPRWRLVVFLLMLTVICILVFGSLWIMSNLNYRMTPGQMNTYMQNQQGL